MKKVLFSPVGGTDPIAPSTEKDGSMLHICRVYKPDVVYLYMSAEMLKRHIRDNRYVYCIERLGEYLNHKFEIHIIERPEFVNVQDYDYCFEEFQGVFKEIEEKLEADDVLYLNIASGTPAMKGGLLFLATIGEYKYIPVQVTTPDEHINKHYGVEDNDYEPELYWSENLDNTPDFINRCKEINCPNLRIVIEKNIISKHIAEYDYAAAYRLAGDLKDNMSDKAYNMISMALARQQLDIKKVQQFEKSTGTDILPVRQGNRINLVEYTLGLRIKYKRKEYGDFIRAISPLLTDLFEAIIKEKCKVDLRKKYWYEDNKGIWKWKKEKMEACDEGRKILSKMEVYYGNEFRDNTAVMASNLVPVINCLLSDNGKIVKKVNDLRNIEEKIRNLAAHEIVAITDENISDKLEQKISIEQIYENIKSLVSFIGIGNSESIWYSYEIMNDMIIDEINS